MRDLIKAGIEGRTFKATLWLYVGSIIVLAPVAIPVWLVFGYEKLLFATPFMVLVLVGITYAYCYFGQIAAFLLKPRVTIRRIAVKFSDASHREATPESH